MKLQVRQPAILRRFVLLGVLLSALVVPTHAMGQKVLRWKFAPGLQLTQTVDQKTEMAMSVGGRDVQMSMTQTIDGLWKVESVADDGTASMVQTIRRIRMTVKADGMDFAVDTDSKEEPEGMAAQIAPALKALVDAKFQLKMTAEGEVLDVTIPKELAEALKSMPGGDQFSSSFGKEGMKKMITQGTPSFPKQGVEKGASWKREFSVETPPIGTMDFVTTYTYGGVAEGTPKLDKLKVDMKQSVKPAAAGGPQVTVKDQTTDGEILFDNEAGRMVRSNIKQGMTLQISVGEQTIDQKLIQTIKVSFAIAK